MKRKHFIITTIILLIVILSIVLTKCDGDKSDDYIPVYDDYYIDSSNNNEYVLQTDTIKNDYVFKKRNLKGNKITLRIGNKPSIKAPPGLHQRPTTIWGNKIFYNSKTIRPFSLHPYGPNSNDLSEPDWFIQLQYEFKKNNYVGLHFNKEKFMPNKNRFGFGGPTDLGISLGVSKSLFGTDWISTNVSLAAGGTVGDPRFETAWWQSGFGEQHIYSDKISVSGYENIGLFSTLVTRFDFKIKKRFNLFVATTFNYRFIYDYQTSIGAQNTGNIYSFGINVGMGINFNYNKKNPKMKFLSPRFL